MDSRMFEFTWKIANFSMLPHRKGEYLLSSGFTVDIIDKTEFFLKLYPKGTNEIGEDMIFCALQRKKAVNPLIIDSIDYSLKLESVHSEYNKIKSCKSQDFLSGQAYGWDFLLLKELNEISNGYLPQDVLTIKCQVCPAVNTVSREIEENLEIVNSDFTYKSGSVTTVPVFKRCFTWPITKIKECMKNKSKTYIYVKSALVDAPAFTLLFHFGKDKKSEYAKIEIASIKSMSSSIFVKCKITLVSTQKVYQDSKEDTFLFGNNKEIWNFPDFIKMKNLSDGKYIHLDNTLYLLCEFSYTGNEVSHAELPTYLPEMFQTVITSQSPSNHLTQKIQSLYQSEKLCDVSLNVGKQSFPAQKLVLCAQSPVFYAMFENDMKEKNTNVVKIEDIEPNTLKILLEFLHSNVMEEELPFEEILKLYSAADKYQIALLKHQCAVLLLSLMSTGNVCNILVVADRHNDNFLLTHVKNFLKMHPIEVFHSRQWKEFQTEDPELFGSFMFQIIQDS